MMLRSATYALLALALAAPLGAATVAEAYPLLTTGPLAAAVAADLRAGTVLQAPGVTITEKELATAIGKAAPALRGQLEQRPFVVLESEATSGLLGVEAEAWCRERKLDLKGRDASRAYLTSLAAKAKVSDGDIETFYRENKESMAGVPLEEAQGDIRDFLLGERRQAAIREHVQGLAGRTTVRVSASWLKSHYPAEIANPVDAARRSGRATLVEFGGTNCIPCRRMAPILERARKDFAGRLNVLTVEVSEERVLAARFGIGTIPVQVVFDRQGKERFRHVGIYAERALRARLAEVGVK